jgi:hypothetical protein
MINKFLIIIFYVFVLVNFVNAQQSYIKDERGRIVGSVNHSHGKTTYRDSSGKVTGTSTKNSGQNIYRDNNGRITGRETSNRGTTSYTDSSGRPNGSASESNGVVVFRDNKGRIIGYYDLQHRDSTGKPKGRSTKNPKENYPLHMNQNKPKRL